MQSVSCPFIQGDNPDSARDRFRFYRDRGYELNTHKL
jgi:DNA polymerase IIIc chi subunit